MRFIVKWSKTIIQISIILLLALLLFELCYRYSIIDFYKSEVETLEGKNQEVDYLVFGDSFTAATPSYVNFLSQNTQATYVNSGVSGIGIAQINTFANKRIQEYEPKHIIYQVYVGNDLIDIVPLTNWKTLPFLRNVYHTVSSRLRSISYLNYKLSGFASKKRSQKIRALHTSFSPEQYDARTQLYLKADPYYIAKSIRITADFEARYHKWVKGVQQFLDNIPEDTAVTIIFIPHSVQLNNTYQTRLEQVGAHFQDSVSIQQDNYPFFERAVHDFAAYPNLQFLNPLAYLQEKDSIQPLYYENDIHFNQKGQEVLAEYLKGELGID